MLRFINLRNYIYMNFASSFRSHTFFNFKKYHKNLIFSFLFLFSSLTSAQVSSVVKHAYVGDVTGDGFSDFILIYEAEDFFLPIHGDIITPIYVDAEGDAYLVEFDSSAYGNYFSPRKINKYDYDLSSMEEILISGFVDGDGDGNSDDIVVSIEVGLPLDILLTNVSTFGQPSLTTDISGDGDFNLGDSDGDGISDEEELAVNTNSNSVLSFPELKINFINTTGAVINESNRSVLLSWSVQGASRIDLISEYGDVYNNLGHSARINLNPSKPTNYSLVISSPSGEVTKSIFIDSTLSAPSNLWGKSVSTDLLKENINTSITLADDGSTYIAGFDSSYSKISPNGMTEWTIQELGLVLRKGIVIEDDIIISADTSKISNAVSKGSVYRLKSNGEISWQFPSENDAALNSEIMSKPVLSADNSIIYVFTYYGHVLALDVESGSCVWSQRVLSSNSERILGDPFLDYSNNQMVLPITSDSGRYLASFDMSSGNACSYADASESSYPTTTVDNSQRMKWKFESND